MRRSIIVAMAENYVIGKDNKLPWYIPEDLKRFKKITLGKSIIMGRKTFESIGHPLKERINIVLSKSTSLKVEGIFIAHSIEEALSLSANSDEVFFIGGAKVFEEVFHIIDTIYLTLVHHQFEGDTFFPYKNLNESFELREEGSFLFKDLRYSFYRGIRKN